VRTLYSIACHDIWLLVNRFIMLSNFYYGTSTINADGEAGEAKGWIGNGILAKSPLENVWGAQGPNETSTSVPSRFAVEPACPGGNGDKTGHESN